MIALILIEVGDEKTFSSPFFTKSTKWQSLTPFISTQHLKAYRDGRPKIDESSRWQKGSAAHSLLNLLAKDPKTAGKLKLDALKQEKNDVQISTEKRLRCLQFQTLRHDGNVQGAMGGNGDAGAFVLEFFESFQGPLAFEYGSHFGLGLFVPME